MNNRTAPSHWVDHHADYLYGFAIHRVNDQETAKDLVQDTFLAALKNYQEFKGDSLERTWLTSILKNKIIDFYRKQSSLKHSKKSALSNIDTDDFFEESGHWRKLYYPEPWEKDAGSALESKEFLSILQKCMDKLPGLWESVFAMKHVEEYNSEKICKELKLSSSNFWIIMHRTKLSLRACMEKSWL